MHLRTCSVSISDLTDDLYFSITSYSASNIKMRTGVNYLDADLYGSTTQRGSLTGKPAVCLHLRYTVEISEIRMCIKPKRRRNDSDHLLLRIMHFDT